jgi:hypothetical protein
MAACSQAEAEKVVQLAKKKISSDKAVKKELGTAQQIKGLLGFGSPSPGVIAVSFSASFKREGGFFTTMSGEKKKANRGEVVAKVSAKTDGGKLVSCVIAKDGGWGKSINVAC